MERSTCLECSGKLDEEWIANLCAECIRKKSKIAGGTSRQLEQCVGLCDAKEGCHLVAVATGEGWGLYVEDEKGETIAMLDFDKVIPKQYLNNGAISAQQLREIGYEVV